MSPQQEDVTRIEVDKAKSLAVLRVLTHELEFPMRMPFSLACRQLAETGCKHLVVDLTRVQRLISVFIGSLADLGLRAIDAEESLTILARPRVVEALRMVNLHKPLNVRIVESKGSGTSAQSRPKPQ